MKWKSFQNESFEQDRSFSEIMFQFNVDYAFGNINHLIQFFFLSNF